MRAHGFELVGADRCGYGVAGTGQIGVEEAVGQRAHREARLLVAMPQPHAGLGDDDRGKELVRLAGESQQLRAGSCHGRRLVVQAAVAGQRRIGADHHRLGMPLGDALCLQLGQRLGDVLRCRLFRREAELHFFLVDARRLDREIEAGILQHLTP